MTPPPPPSSASAPAPAVPPTTTTTRRYAVLYYKRSFGSSASSTSTSKNRGNTARSDGILTIAPPPSCMCQLLTTAGDGDHHEEEEDESEEEENDSEGDGEDDDGGGSTRGGTKKQKWNKFKNRRQQQTAKQKKNRSKQRQQQRPNAIVWSGVNTDLSRRAYQHDTMTGNMATMTTTLIRENDTLVLNGQWACEIVSLLDYHHSDTVATTTGATSSVATSSLDGRNVGLMNRGCNSSSTTMVMKQPSHLLSQVLVGGKLGKCGNSMATTNLVKGGGLKNDHASSNSMTMPRAPLSSVRANVIQQPLRSKKTVTAVGLGHGHGHGSPRTTELTTRRVGLGSGSCHASVCKSTTTATLSATATAVTADVRGTTSDRKRQKDAPDGKDDDADDESDGEDCDHDKHETHGGNPSSSKIPPSLLRSTTTFAKRPRTAPTLVSSTSLSLSGNDIRNNTGMNDFPGAKGERINVPTSLRNILRPHQREGIAFLWNCVTGVNDGLKNAYRSARSSSTSGSAGDSLDEDDDDDDDGIGKGSSVSLSVGDVPRGAVLADEMGLGKVIIRLSLGTTLHWYQCTFYT